MWPIRSLKYAAQSSSLRLPRAGKQPLAGGPDGRAMCRLGCRYGAEPPVLRNPHMVRDTGVAVVIACLL